MFKNKNRANDRLQMLREQAAAEMKKEESSSMANPPDADFPLENLTIVRCVCNRKPQTLICIKCKMFTYGRVTQMCPKHANVTFLMDFYCCPNCLGPTQLLRSVDIDYACLDPNGNVKSNTASSYSGNNFLNDIRFNRF